MLPKYRSLLYTTLLYVIYTDCRSLLALNINSQSPLAYIFRSPSQPVKILLFCSLCVCRRLLWTLQWQCHLGHSKKLWLIDWLTSVGVCNTPWRNVTHQGTARGGPVVLRPVRAKSCYYWSWQKVLFMFLLWHYAHVTVTGWWRHTHLVVSGSGRNLSPAGFRPRDASHLLGIEVGYQPAESGQCFRCCTNYRYQ